jgi:hypothetical protein
MVSGTAAVSFVDQALEPDVLALLGQLGGKPDVQGFPAPPNNYESDCLCLRN